MTINHKLSFTADAFYEMRRDILLSTEKINSQIVGVPTAWSNSGAVDSYGLETSAMWKDKIGDFSYSVGGNFTFVRSTIVENNEGKVAHKNLSNKGLRVGQYKGVEVDGFFESDAEASMSNQMFSAVQAGDIRYKDQTNDGIIDQNDIIPMGYSTITPEIFYGLNLDLNYKGFGFNAQFQGISNYTVVLDTPGVYFPLVNNSNISKWYLNDNIPWTPETADTATLPRLTTEENRNNFRNNSLWMEDGSYFKLRNLQVYYNLPTKMTIVIGLQALKIYVSGNNLFSIDKIKYSNCENIGIGYPDQRIIYAGVNIKF